MPATVPGNQQPMTCFDHGDVTYIQPDAICLTKKYSVHTGTKVHWNLGPGCMFIEILPGSLSHRLRSLWYLLPTTYVIRRKVIFSQVSVILCVGRVEVRYILLWPCLGGIILTRGLILE